MELNDLPGLGERGRSQARAGEGEGRKERRKEREKEGKKVIKLADGIHMNPAMEWMEFYGKKALLDATYAVHYGNLGIRTVKDSMPAVQRYS